MAGFWIIWVWDTKFKWVPRIYGEISEDSHWKQNFISIKVSGGRVQGTQTVSNRRDVITGRYHYWLSVILCDFVTFYQITTQSWYMLSRINHLRLYMPSYAFPNWYERSYMCSKTFMCAHMYIVCAPKLICALIWALVCALKLEWDRIMMGEGLNARGQLTLRPAYSAVPKSGRMVSMV